jgi:hypothetical protein
MTFSPSKGWSSSMLSKGQAESLLHDLCVKLGFCLPPHERDRLASEPPANFTAFTRAVFVAEGLDPSTADRVLYRQVEAMVGAAFGRSMNSKHAGG